MTNYWKTTIFVFFILPFFSTGLHGIHPVLKNLFVSKGHGDDKPDFILTDTAGNKVSLSSFRGKFVIIVMTADWCGPCKQETEPTRAMQYDYLKSDIVWIFVSFEKDMNTWKEIIRKNKLPGIHLWGKPQSEYLKKIFDFNSIPYYIWIDKDGTIAESDAPRPSNSSASKHLKYYLK